MIKRNHKTVANNKAKKIKTINEKLNEENTFDFEIVKAIQRNKTNLTFSQYGPPAVKDGTFGRCWALLACIVQSQALGGL